MMVMPSSAYGRPLAGTPMRDRGPFPTW
jgi:hypothetical protein